MRATTLRLFRELVDINPVLGQSVDLHVSHVRGRKPQRHSGGRHIDIHAVAAHAAHQSRRLDHTHNGCFIAVKRDGSADGVNIRAAEQLLHALPVENHHHCTTRCFTRCEGPSTTNRHSGYIEEMLVDTGDARRHLVGGTGRGD